MLVFTRRKHETIMIGDGIEVRVLRVGREGVRIAQVRQRAGVTSALDLYQAESLLGQAEAALASITKGRASRPNQAPAAAKNLASPIPRPSLLRTLR